ncbi:ABC transporter permease [Alkalimonas delamerensis]|uniref:ABC transporter permease n=1 Tax=Alkalimonas delamerensis TaxID=265981 RepID=A0ABT9GTD9_9GAMM|nr:ABC transporter permease [Alkalimonas delamerensis]MDP4530154.1 ABC transporter permease [Alkalimonas delamerensis]
MNGRLIWPMLWRSFQQSRHYYLTVVVSLVFTLTLLFSVLSLVNITFFAPLPYQNDRELYFVGGELNYQGAVHQASNVQTLFDLQEKSQFLQQMAVYFSFQTEYKLLDQPTRPSVPVLFGAHDIFEVMGVEPLLGRLFNEQEQMGNKQPSVVLSQAIWQQHYGARPDIIGQSVQLNQRQFTVIGVVKQALELPGFTDAHEAIWLPLDMDEFVDIRGFDGYSGGFAALGRLKPGVSVQEANAEAYQLLKQASAERHPDFQGVFEYYGKVVPLRQQIQGDSGRLVLMLMAGVSLLTLIALVNLSSMQLARAVKRLQPLAVCYAFGASKKQMFLQVFRHNIALLAGAGLLALLLTWLGFGVIANVASEQLPRISALRIDGMMLLLTALVLLVIALLFSWIELSGVREQQLMASLQSSGKGAGKQLKQGVAHTLIGVQLMLSLLVLLATAHVFVATWTEANRPTGIDSTELWSITVNYSDLDNREQRQNQHRALLQNLVALPQVQQVTAVSEPRAPRVRNQDTVSNAQGEVITSARIIRVLPGYFQFYGLELSGQDFTAEQVGLEHYPLIINQRLADRIARTSGKPALGQTLSIYQDSTQRQIIGVVANTNFPGDPSYEVDEVFYPSENPGWRDYSYLLKLNPGDALTDTALLELLRQQDPRLDLIELTTVAAAFHRFSLAHRLAAALAATLALMSLLTVLAGIAGIVIYLVQARRYQLGVEMAMGASLKQLLKDNLVKLAQPIAAALLLGFSCFFFLAGISRTQPELMFQANWSLVAVLLALLALAALLCSFVPLRRVLLTDPVKALRNE